MHKMDNNEAVGVSLTITYHDRTVQYQGRSVDEVVALKNAVAPLSPPPLPPVPIRYDGPQLDGPRLDPETLAAVRRFVASNPPKVDDLHLVYQPTPEAAAALRALFGSKQQAGGE